MAAAEGFGRADPRCAAHPSAPDAFQSRTGSRAREEDCSAADFFHAYRPRAWARGDKCEAAVGDGPGARRTDSYTGLVDPCCAEPAFRIDRGLAAHARRGHGLAVDAVH